nr:MAG TPA: hypothetical protein [Caudoviricetes sp.]
MYQIWPVDVQIWPPPLVQIWPVTYQICPLV